MPTIDELLEQLTLEERASLTAGLDNWSTVPIPRLGLPAVVLSDGPAGARGATRDHESLTPSVCIPSGTALGASFDPALVREASAVVARQAREKGAGILLAPTVNLHRHPLWGRNFEAFSEDPTLSGTLAVAYIEGVEGEGLAATIKHFIGNETEFERYTSSSDIDERALRECYLLPFEYAVRVARVHCLMTSYNRVNGEHVPDRADLVRDVLRDEWGFNGLVMTDWWGLAHTDAAGEAGLDLEMPGPARAFGDALAEAVRQGRVGEAILDAKVRRLLELYEWLGTLQEAATDGSARPLERPLDRSEDRQFLRRAAAACTVLLANDGVLPLATSGLRSVAVIGPKAHALGIMGGGSARVTPHYELSFADALADRLGGEVVVQVETATTPSGREAAVALAASCDVAVVVVGTDDSIESEGFDRTSMRLPDGGGALVAAVVAANPRSVVVVTSGAPVEIEWPTERGALVQSFFAGQEAAHGLVDVIVGDAEPGGRLPTTIPLRLEHTPAYASFPGEAGHVPYRESLLIGYRWYEARALPVAFPFGHGLSYSRFEFGEPRLLEGSLRRDGFLEVEVPVRNVGERRGSEVVQCYVAPPSEERFAPGHPFRAPKELRAYEKVSLDPGEDAVVRLRLGPRSFARYEIEDGEWADLDARRAQTPDPSERPIHRDRAGWYVARGTYEILVGRSSADISHSVAIEIDLGDEPLDRSTMPG